MVQIGGQTSTYPWWLRNTICPILGGADGTTMCCRGTRRTKRASRHKYAREFCLNDTSVFVGGAALLAASSSATSSAKKPLPAVADLARRCRRPGLCRSKLAAAASGKPGASVLFNRYMSDPLESLCSLKPRSLSTKHCRKHLPVEAV